MLSVPRAGLIEEKLGATLTGRGRGDGWISKKEEKVRSTKEGSCGRYTQRRRGRVWENKRKNIASNFRGPAGKGCR